MKYEYTHGSESEFNNAPGWAKLAINDGYSNAFCNELDYMATAVWSNGRQFKIANPTKFTVVGARKLVSEESEWNGEGLPPVGSMVETVDPDGLLVYGHDESGEVIAYVENTAVVRMSYGLGCFEARFLRPLRSEADKKRDEATHAMASAPKPCGHAIHGICCEIYDAIAAGKIPGVKLED